MNKILNKRIHRDLKTNFSRYLALLLMIVAGMFIVIAVVGAADTIVSGTNELAVKNKVEDGQFSVFLPLTEKQEQKISQSGVTIEKMFYADIEMTDGSTLRLMKTREEINLIQLDKGVLPTNNGEAVLEKRYAKEHNISVGDSIKIGGVTVGVTGIGSVPEYDMPIAKLSDTAVESSLFGLIFVTSQQYDKILAENSVIEEYCYAYRLNDKLTHDELKEMLQSFEFDYNDIEDEYFLEMLEDTIGRKENLQEGIAELNNGARELSEGIAAAGFEGTELHIGANELYNGTTELKEETDKLLDDIFDIDIDNLTSFMTAEDNPRILAASIDVQMNKDIGLIAGVILIILFAYVISVFVINQIQRESSIIGTLYALGIKKKDLIRHYITLPTIICFIGGLIGSMLGFSNFGIQWQMSSTYSYFSIPDLAPYCPLYLIIYGFLMPPVISVIVNYIVISKRLSKTPLSLIRNEQKVSNRSKIRLGKMSFIRLFQIRQLLREARTGITVVFGMFICLLVFMLAFNSSILCNNIKVKNAADTKFSYMYTLKYPEKTAPKNAEVCYTESLSITDRGYTLDVSIIGIDNDNKYYPAKPQKGRNSIIAATSTAQKYNLSVGDKLILTDKANDTDYVFTVDGIAEYSVGLSVFMDIDSMRELFGQDEDYYNMLLSDSELDIDMGKVYSVTTKADVEKASSIFVEMMIGMVTMLISMSILIFCVVMYLMINVMVDRASFGISLVKIFGFREKEVRKLYLDGNALTVAIGAIITIPLAKIIMDAIYPTFLAQNVCGIDIAFPWYAYVMMFVAIMLFYFIVNSILVGKIKKITPAEVLKNRE